MTEWGETKGLSKSWIITPNLAAQFLPAANMCTRWPTFNHRKRPPTKSKLILAAEASKKSNRGFAMLWNTGYTPLSLPSSCIQLCTIWLMLLLHVPPQLIAPHECTRAQGASKPFLTGVHGHVRLQMSQLLEPTRAHFTLVRLLSCVSPLVSLNTFVCRGDVRTEAARWRSNLRRRRLACSWLGCVTPTVSAICLQKM